MPNIDLMQWDIITEENFNAMQFDSGVLVKNFDPTTFELPGEGDIVCATSGDFNLTYNTTKVDLGDGVNNIFFKYAELQVITGVDAATLTVTALDFSTEGIKRALGAADISDSGKVTPRLYISPSDFENIAWVGAKVGGGLVAVVMPKALSTGGLSITATKGGKGSSSLTITGFRTINDKTKAEMEFYSIDAPSGGIVITAQPKSTEVTAGADVEFEVTATGGTGYQWQLLTPTDYEYRDITGKTTDTLALDDVTVDANGNMYRCKVTSATGAAYSKPAKLTVNAGV